jgi:YgiT-type zinc finger domain-containing protein
VDLPAITVLTADGVKSAVAVITNVGHRRRPLDVELTDLAAPSLVRLKPFVIDNRLVERVARPPAMGRGVQNEEEMDCHVCGLGETAPGTATVTLERDDLILVVRGARAEVCADCGEESVDQRAASRLLVMADEAAASGVQVDARAYHAA